MDGYLDKYDKEWSLRKKNNQAEGIFENHLDCKKIEYVKCGIDALEKGLPGLRYVTDFVRCQPDYLVFNNVRKPIFVEVKGFADFVKLKPKDLRSYRKWKTQHPVWLFIYNLKDNTRCLINIDSMDELIKKKSPKIKHYPESKNNRYYEIPPAWLNFESID